MSKILKITKEVIKKTSTKKKMTTGLKCFVVVVLPFCKPSCKKHLAVNWFAGLKCDHSTEAVVVVSRFELNFAQPSAVSRELNASVK